MSERLTNIEKYADPRIFWERNLGKIYNKLSQYEDIEEKFGCDLEIYYKMVITGTTLYSMPHPEVEQWYHKYIYHKDENGRVSFCLKIQGYLEKMYYADEYGKTWAFTKEELKND